MRQHKERGTQDKRSESDRTENRAGKREREKVKQIGERDRQTGVRVGQNEKQ